MSALPVSHRIASEASPGKEKAGASGRRIGKQILFTAKWLVDAFLSCRLLHSVFAKVLLCIALSSYIGIRAEACPSTTGSSATVIFPSWVTGPETGLRDGDTVRAFDEAGLCLGEATWNEMESVVLTIWSDDPVTPHKDGAIEGEQYEIVSLILGEKEYDSLAVDFDQVLGSPSGTIFYSEAVYIVGEVQIGGSAGSAPEQPLQFEIGNVYPNPFRGSATLRLTVSESTHVQVIVYDMLGRRVGVLHDGTIEGGQPQHLTIESAGLSSGSYIVWLASEQFVETRSLILMH